jgi:hypothetical protein
MDRIITYTPLGIRATEATWRAAGVRPYSNTDEIDARNLDSFRYLEELLMLAVHATGTRDDAAVAWAVAERNRREEERTRSTAHAREAEAITKLASAIRDSGEDSTLERIIGRLSERTQYAVRQQLKRNA